MNKRFFAFLLAMALILSLVPSTAFAVGDGLHYEYASEADGQLYVVVTGYTGTAPDVTIPATFNGYPVRAIADEAFKGNKTLTRVTISEGITGVGELAFQSCTALTEVTLPSTLTDMGWLIFFDCTALKTVTIPEGISVIGYGMFDDCDNLTEAKIPGSVTVIDSYAFGRCKKLTGVVLPEGLTAIGHQAFWECAALTEITIPETVTVIGRQAFYKCKNLERIIFRGDAPSLGDLAFHGTTANVYYPANNPTWTDEVMADQYSKLTWIPYAPLSFTDVTLGEFYYDSVAWAVNQGITSGTSDTTFSPAASCNRAQAVTFLWAAAGKPEPTITEHSFVDVPKGSFCEKAVLWAVEKGITTGTDETHFSPLATCNRATIVTFLYKAFNSPEVSAAENPFEDVPDESWYTVPALWAKENGITSGTDATHFSPASICNRAQIVTFLYGAYN